MTPDTTAQRRHGDPTAATDPIIEMRNASVTYDDGETFVLDDVSMAIERNEVVGVARETRLHVESRGFDGSGVHASRADAGE
ncbi:hypothetical protein [Natrinema caseinilyticum]|uniref:hypothetical protein n=1 Tax=Natrinema caseinilyticum TaxID=2961570 RepID=UPI0020C55CB1|nr:hypothetical protein [Natrinema caseinilyticum]